MIPKHIAVIMDGNRRFAKRLLKYPWEGHRFGILKARELLEWACKKGIKYVTAYVLSLENIYSRPKKELKMILRFLEQELDEIVKNTKHVVHRFSVNVKFIGRIWLMPKILQEKMKKVEEITKKYTSYYLNIAIAYGGRQEIVDAIKKIVKLTLNKQLSLTQINEEVVKKYLYTNTQPDPDLIIRSGGEKRLSNFLTFQSAYTELIFIDKMWPELTIKDFEHALKEFEKRERRFGK